MLAPDRAGSQACPSARRPGSVRTRGMTEETGAQMLELAEQLFERMITQQQAKVLRLARQAVPNIGPEDLRNAHDFPELREHPTFEYEDGLLAGLISAQIAVRAEIKGRLLPPVPPRG